MSSICGIEETWISTDPAQEALIELETKLKHCIQDIKTLIRCRRGCFEYGLPKDSDLFIDDIRKNLKIKTRLRIEIFKLCLKHGQIF